MFASYIGTTMHYYAWVANDRVDEVRDQLKPFIEQEMAPLGLDVRASTVPVNDGLNLGLVIFAVDDVERGRQFGERHWRVCKQIDAVSQAALPNN